MPIYEYKCANGHVFDVIQRMSDEALTECQECGAPAERVLHPVAIHFKGSGFHNTDYGKKKTGANGSSRRQLRGKLSEGSKDSSDSKPSESKSSDSKSRQSRVALEGGGVASPSARDGLGGGIVPRRGSNHPPRRSRGIGEATPPP